MSSKGHWFPCGDINMKGRKTQKVACGCCGKIQNQKNKLLKKIHRKEAKDTYDQV